ncbi:metal-sulfur cluster assembly factor [Consotaella salsifontis]|uniref:Metal-sulfur cluster biosynthetic enzyme n=1 Tax=Consotaella salsifontis TaxID=1365950 RepID=A0A1T4LCS3_9HYPH|nr:iron-sulfur cluster assembly protein [Consotaella salsifontis]SJZ52443.1 Metal-sulfur cluster biosynthetic enzyme [Consotaella salsifontis]
MGDPAEVVRAALATVDDTELGINIVDLGLVLAIEIGEGHVAICLMMTTPTCPLGALIAETARAAVEQRLGAGWVVSVELDRAAKWSPDLAVEAVRERFAPRPSALGHAVKAGFSRLFGAP